MESGLAKSMSAPLKLNRAFSQCFAKLALIFFLLTGFATMSIAGIFSYRDDKGAIHFTDDLNKIPKEVRESEKGVSKHLESRGSHRVVPNSSQKKSIELPGYLSTGQEIQIPLIPVNGGNFLVDTVLNGRVKARLMLDTGASLVTLTELIGKKLGVSSYSSSAELPFSTAGGEEWMPLLSLDTVAIGSAKAQLVEASINSHIKDIDGLLGMSFLGDFRFEIDRTNKLLTLKPAQKSYEVLWGGRSGNWWKGRFEHYETIIKNYAARAGFLKRNGHPKAPNLENTVKFYESLRHRLQLKASRVGLPENFRSSM